MRGADIYRSARLASIFTRAILSIVVLRKIMLILTILCLSMHAANIGSDSTLTRFLYQQVAHDGDRIAGFASIEAGFLLLDGNTTATFDSVLPVSGSVALNGGTLYLKQDFILHELAAWTTLGNILGNNHTFELSPMIMTVPAATAQENISCVGLLITEIGVGGRVTTHSWSSDSQFIAVGFSSTGGPTNLLRIYQFNGSMLTLKQSLNPESETRTINAARWHPSLPLLAIAREATSTASNREVLIYSYDAGTNTLTLQSGLNLNVNVYTCSWSPDGNFLAIASASTNRPLSVYAVTSGGVISGPVATVNLGSGRTVDRTALDWSSAGDYIGVGLNQNAGTELRVYKFNGSSLVLDADNSTLPSDYNRNVTTLDFSPIDGDVFLVGLQGATNKLHTVLLTPGNPVGTGSLSELSAAATDNAVVRAAQINPTATCIAVGWSNGVFKNYSFNSSTYAIVQTFSRSVGNSVESVWWSPDGRFVSHGGSNNMLSIYQGQSGNIIQFPNKCVTFTDLNLVLNNDVIFQNCCITFQGQSSITGNGYALSLRPTCSFTVGSNSSLLIRDIDLNNISDNRLQNTDSTSTYSFKDVKLVLDGNFTLTQGRFDVIGELDIVGNGYSFRYQSDQVCTVSSNAKLIIDDGVTFSYAPRIASNSLLNMADNTALLRLQGGSLYATSTGLRLLKGNFEVDGFSSLISDATSSANGILFGDGALVNNNVNIHLLPAAELNISKGYVGYRNV
jgi:hypothetical protein